VVAVEGWMSRDSTRFTADRVVYSDNVVGPVASVGPVDPDTNEKEIEVLGQIVVVNFITKFQPDTFDFYSIAVNDVVEVSGYIDDTGAVRATFIEKTGVFNTGVAVEVKGSMLNLHTVNKTFEINNLSIDYAQADLSGLPESQFAEGLFVEVEGTLDTLDGKMMATKILLGDELESEDGDEFEIMGYVTEIISNADIIEFKVGNQVVHIDPGSAVFVDGDAGDIAAGARLEAEGSIEGGILYADEIEFWKPDQIEVEGLVSHVASDTEFNLGIQLVQTNSDTVYENVEPNEIEIGMRLEVKGVPLDAAHSVLVADKVSLEID
jgi:hypothetical protein